MGENTGKRSALHDVVACILPIVSLVAALGLAVIVFRRVDSSVTTAQAELANAEQSEAAVEQQTVYAGVHDPWIEAGSFTVGDEGLDASIRDFCDAHTYEGATADEAARETYEAIVTSTYLYRVDKPMGLDWVARSAREFFASDDGMGGHQGDVYEFASVLALCLRYFGYGDAIAVPIVSSSSSDSSDDGGALCIVTSADGVESVCDPSIGTSGWMLPRAGYQILVEDIGQNLDVAEGRGLQIKKKYDDESENTSSGDEMGSSGYGSTTSGSGMSGSGTSGSYGSGTSGYDDSTSSYDSYGGYSDDSSDSSDYSSYDSYGSYDSSSDTY